MPIYVHEVVANVIPESTGAPPPGTLRPEQFQALVAAVARELERRQQRSRAMQAETAITGQNRPPSLGS